MPHAAEEEHTVVRLLFSACLLLSSFRDTLAQCKAPSIVLSHNARATQTMSSWLTESSLHLQHCAVPRCQLRADLMVASLLARALLALASWSVTDCRSAEWPVSSTSSCVCSPLTCSCSCCTAALLLAKDASNTS